MSNLCWLVRGVAPTKGNLLVSQGDESVVGDGHAMGVAAQILEHILAARPSGSAPDRKLP